MSLSALQRLSYSDFTDERQATKEATMSTAFDRSAARLTAFLFAAAVTVATLAGLDRLAQQDQGARLAQAAATAPRG
jgi:hypothetical protein